VARALLTRGLRGSAIHRGAGPRPRASAAAPAARVRHRLRPQRPRGCAALPGLGATAHHAPLSPHPGRRRQRRAHGSLPRDIRAGAWGNPDPQRGRPRLHPRRQPGAGRYQRSLGAAPQQRYHRHAGLAGSPRRLCRVGPAHRDRRTAIEHRLMAIDPRHRRSWRLGREPAAAGVRRERHWSAPGSPLGTTVPARPPP